MRAYEADADVALLGYLLWQGLLLTLLWGYFGGAIYRLAAVDLIRKRREDGRRSFAFARRHWRGFVGARLALWLGAGLPLVAAVLLALVGRWEGPLGGLLLAVAAAAAFLLAFVACMIGSVGVVAGFLTGPTVACEDSDAFDAVSRTFLYAGAGLPRMVLYRLLFFAGVLLGAGWRFVRSAFALLLAYACLRLGGGEQVMDRVGAILQAFGAPPDADRLGVLGTDYLVAGVVVLGVCALSVLWLADLVTRIQCARTAVYLLLRHDIDQVPLTELRTPPRIQTSRSAEEAGFVEVGRIE